MIQSPDLSLLAAVLIVLVALALQVFVVWLVWRIVRRWRHDRQAGNTRRAMAVERQNFASVETAPLALRSIGARHEAAHQALRRLSGAATPEEALATLRRHLPTTGLKPLRFDLAPLWELSRHPPFLAALAGAALDHLDAGQDANGDFRQALVTVFDNAPAQLIRQLDERLQRRSDRLASWTLSGGLDDIRRAAALRAGFAPDADAAKALQALGDSLQPRALAEATQFAAWSVARCEAAGTEEAVRELATRVAFNCRPLMGPPLAAVRAAFHRHQKDPRWRAAALSFDAMVVASYARDTRFARADSLDDFDFAAALEQVCDGLGDYDHMVADAAGHAAADIIEAGHFRDMRSLLTLESELHSSQNIHWPRPPGQQRLFELLAKTPSEGNGPADV